MTPGERWETPVEKAIREARERGEFDDLPGSGKPLGDLGSPDDPTWWVRRLAEREHLDLTAALPPAVALRKEAAAYPESLADLRSETAVREVLEDFNRRVRRDRLRPAVGPLPPVLAPTVDVEEMLCRWRAVRAAAPPAPLPPPAPPTARRPWWGRSRGIPSPGAPDGRHS